MSEPSEAAPLRRRKVALRNWRVRFLTSLAETSNVSAAAQEARISLSWVYQTKREDRDFAEAWLVALCEGYDRLELDLLARLRSGEPRAVGETPAPRFDNATALRLLLAHREARARYTARQDNVSAEAVRRSIEQKLARLREQVLAREAAERQAGEREGGDGG